MITTNGEVLPGTRNAALQLVSYIAGAIVYQMKEQENYSTEVFHKRVHHLFPKWRRYIPSDYENVDDKLEQIALAIHGVVKNATDTTTSEARIEHLLSMMFESK